MAACPRGGRGEEEGGGATGRRFSPQWPKGIFTSAMGWEVDCARAEILSEPQRTVDMIASVYRMLAQTLEARHTRRTSVPLCTLALTWRPEVATPWNQFPLLDFFFSPTWTKQKSPLSDDKRSEENKPIRRSYRYLLRTRQQRWVCYSRKTRSTSE